MMSLLNGGFIDAFATGATKNVMPNINVIALAPTKEYSAENLQ